LVRALFPIFFFVLILTGAAFYANNNLVPKAALEAYSLLYDIKQKKPALDLREGSFYNGINDISIKVNKKFPDGITLKDVVVYDHRKNDGNKEVTVADSGKMYTILNERYLKFELFNGYNYSEGGTTQREVEGKRRSNTNSDALSRRKFDKSQVVFDLSSFQFERTDKKWFQGNRIMRNLNELNYDMDSIKNELLSQQINYYDYRPAYFTYYNEVRRAKLPQELAAYKTIRDSLNDLKYRLAAATVTSPDAVEKRAPKAEIKNDSSTQAQQQLTKPKVKPKPKAKPVPKKDVVKKTPKKVVPPKKKDEVKKE